MKTLFTAFACFLTIAACAQKAESPNAKPATNMPSIYDKAYKVQDISGNTFDLKSLKGKKVMIVNTASKCGLTPQYKELEALYKENKDKNFVIIGFPANNFAEQEPGTNVEIAEFCQKNYGVTFPMMSKVSVKGDDMAGIYEFLTKKSLNGYMDSQVEWNFQKYLLNEKGELVNIIKPQASANNDKVLTWIKS